MNSLKYLLEVGATRREDELVRLEGAIAAGERDVRQRRRRVDGGEQLAQVLQVVVPLQVERLVAHEPLHLHRHKHCQTRNTHFLTFIKKNRQKTVSGATAT